MNGFNQRSVSQQHFPGRLIETVNQRRLGLALHRQPTREQLHKVIGHSQLSLVSLTFAQIGRGCGEKNALGHQQMSTHREHLALVQVRDQLHVHHTVAGFAEVEEVSVLVLVAGAQHDAVVMGGQHVVHWSTHVAAHQTFGEVAELHASQRG